MGDAETPEQGELGIMRAGDRLRMAREGAGLSIADIANRTRITQRHIEAIERSDFNALPSRTYVTGFARAYARAVGLSDAEIAREVRQELDGGAMTPRELYEAYEPADPARVPSRALAYTLLAVVVALIGGYAIWRTLALDTQPVASTTLTSAGGQATPAADAPTPTPAAPPVADDAAVVLTAIDEVWVGFDDAQGKTENYRTLDPGETLTIPADYVGKFTLRTIRPQMLKITVGGREVGPLGPADVLVKNISLKPADLLARTAGGSAPAPAAPSTGR
jgi:cytoskeleton protein RodZ